MMMMMMILFDIKQAKSLHNLHTDNYFYRLSPFTRSSYH